MKLRLDDITTRPSHYTIKHSDWFPSEDDYTVSAEAQIVVSRRDDKYFVLRGELEGSFSTACGRCGESVTKELQGQFEYLVTCEEEPPAASLEVECSDQDVNTLFLDEPEINVDEILREQAYLEIPLRTLCRENCKGICVNCGVDLNKQSCSCHSDNSDSPFAILGKLKK